MIRRSGGLVQRSALFAAVSVMAVVSLACTPTTPPGGPGANDPLTDVVSIGVSDASTCALRTGGEVACWGDNYLGALGIDEPASAVYTPRGVPGLTGATALAAGRYHRCVIQTDTSVACWGSRHDDPPFDPAGPPVTSPQTISGVTDAVKVSAGGDTTCVVTSDGTVSCWGSGGHDPAELSMPIVEVEGLTDVVEVAVGSSHQCALHSDGSVSCWGNDFEGQLGDGDPGGFATPPQAVAGVTDAVAISAGSLHTCVVRAGGGATCWGANHSGQLGNGTASAFETPEQVLDLDDVVSIAAATGHTCAIEGDGAGYCWGSNLYGELGDGTTGQDNSRPQLVVGLRGAAAIAAAGGTSCAVESDGTASCWGNSLRGQLGNGTATNANTAQVVADIA